MVNVIKPHLLNSSMIFPVFPKKVLDIIGKMSTLLMFCFIIDTHYEK